MMRSNRRTIGLTMGLVLALCLVKAAAAAEEIAVSSPDGQVRLKIQSSEMRLSYAVSIGTIPVIEASALAITLDGVDLAADAQVGSAERYDVNETYAWRGVHSEAVNRCNGARISVKHAASGAVLTLEVRSYNDGVAFRWLVPDAGRARTPDEASAFVLPTGSDVWLHGLRGHYEEIHVKKTVGEVQAGEWAAPPLTVKLPAGAGYASITEAALTNYSGMVLRANGQRGFVLRLAHVAPVGYPFTLRYGEAEAKRLAQPAAISGPIVTPWRVVLVGRDLNTLVNSDIIHNLCPPPDAKRFPKGMATDWVKPGRAVWKYLDGGQNTLAEMKEFSRMAGELGFEYHVVEGFWQRWPDADLRDFVIYSKQRNVGVWLWKHTKELRDPEARRAFFKRCQDAGAVGVKLDFLDHEAKEVIDFYQTLLNEAAEHQLMVNFHGSNKPAGEARTWPNELTREAVKGMEGRNVPRARHDATLPFTRMLAGHADYTPVHFGVRRGDTTNAHQIATAAIFTSPLLTYGANPKKLIESPAVEMIKSIPASWDQTIVLSGSEAGEVAVFARRSGATWFLAVVNGPTARSLRVPLTFLGDGEHRALIVRDGKGGPDAVEVETTTARRGDSLAIELPIGGGFVARFSKGEAPAQ